MKTILTKIKHKGIIFEYIQGFASKRHYILPYLISKDNELGDQLKVLNDIKKNNQLSPEFTNNLYVFISDRMLFRIVNEENILENNKDQFINEEGEKEENDYQFLKRKILSYYISGKYINNINVNIKRLKKYLPNKKEFALFIFDFLVNKNKLLSIFDSFNVNNKNDINKFLSYYEENKIFLENNEDEEKEEKIIQTKEEIKDIYDKMNRKVFLNIAFIGYKSSGKSTTIGHLLYSIGNINYNNYIETCNISNLQGAPTYKYSWLVDKLLEERNNRKTIIYHLNKLETNNYEINLIDLPGDFHFKKNIIKGLSLADAVVVVVSADNFNNESALIKDYLIITYTIGVKQIIIAINKMDTLIQSQEKYLEIKRKMKKICEDIGFNTEKILFVAYSGYTGLNLVNKYEDESLTNKMTWYKGKTLLESFDEIEPPKRLFGEPLKISVLTVIKKTGVGTVVRGKILSGRLKKDMTLCFPTGSKNPIVSQCDTIEINYQRVDEGIAGDFVNFKVKGVTVRELRFCNLIFEHNSMHCFQNAEILRVKILKLNDNCSLRVGSNLDLFCYTTKVTVRIAKIEYIIDKANKILEKNPEEIKKGDIAMLIIKRIKRNVPRRIVEKDLIDFYYGGKNINKKLLYCDKYKNEPILGSFAIVNNELLAVGKIKDINSLPEKFY